MEKLEIEKDIQYVDVVEKWHAGIYCPKYNVWSGSFFHKDKSVAEKLAMESFVKMLKSRQSTNGKLKETIEI